MEQSKIRAPVVAGQFYPSGAAGLKKEIELLINKNKPKSDIIACVLPHAGYMYSGKVAAETVSAIKIKDRIILLGPNHTGYGAAFSLMSEGRWQTPLGEIKIDTDLAARILKQSSYLAADELAHIHEHSLEVELPFLQYFKSSFEIVPIILLSDEIAILVKIGRDIASAIKDSGEKESIMLIASSDMTHYEPEEQAYKKDMQAIEAILELNETKLMKRVKNLNISMCGYAPVITMLSAAKSLGAKSAKLIKYLTSAEVTGDKSSVVGYAGIVVY